MKVSILSTAFAVLSSLTSSVVSVPTPNAIQRRNIPGIVYRDGNQFLLNGKPFKFQGTNAYWLFLVNADSDVDTVMASYANTGVDVVRIWGFNEVVGSAPAHGNFTNLWNNGVPTFSQGALSRLQVILDSADKHGVKVIISLTNNWAPTAPKGRPAGYFSNAFGGIDTYVQQIQPGGTHDLFYTDGAIINAFKSTVGNIVRKFTTHPALFSWELANDLRCQGALQFNTSSSCTTTTITSWVNELAGFVRSIDGNHLIGSGDGGFLCPKCPKINGTPNQKRSLFKTKRWAIPNGLAFNGAFGVDSQDISNSPDISYQAFGLFPDETFYGTTNPGLTGKAALTFNPGFTDSTVSELETFIAIQGDQAKVTGKPVVNNGIGITSTNVGSTLSNFISSQIGPNPGQNYLNVTERAKVFGGLTTLLTGSSSPAQGVMTYQVGFSGGLTSVPGSIIDATHPADTGSLSKRLAMPGKSPNDGFGIYPPPTTPPTTTSATTSAPAATTSAAAA